MMPGEMLCVRGKDHEVDEIVVIRVAIHMMHDLSRLKGKHFAHNGSGSALALTMLLIIRV